MQAKVTYSNMYCYIGAIAREDEGKLEGQYRNNGGKKLTGQLHNNAGY